MTILGIFDRLEYSKFNFDLGHEMNKNRRSFFLKLLLGVGAISTTENFSIKRFLLPQPIDSSNNGIFKYSVVTRYDFPENKNFRDFENDMKLWSDEKLKDAVILSLQNQNKISTHMNFSVDSNFFEAKVYFKDQAAYNEYNSALKSLVYENVRESLGYKISIKKSEINFKIG
jgi:hypothetical protein